jgi:hypothetical protein
MSGLCAKTLCRSCHVGNVLLGEAKTAGRAIDDGSVKSKPKKHTDPGRAVDNSGTVKSGRKTSPAALLTSKGRTLASRADFTAYSP